MRVSFRSKVVCEIGRALLFVTVVAVAGSFAHAQNQTPIFPTPQSFLIGVGGNVVTGDFNGDGLSDTVYTFQAYIGGSGDAVGVFLNQGSAPIQPPILTGLVNCIMANGVAVGDLNKDQKLDLVVSCGEDGYGGMIEVLFGNGDGTFQTPVLYPVLFPQAVAQVDLNGDGYPDIVVGTYLNSTEELAVLLNQGASAPGVLSGPVAYPTLLYATISEIAAGDYNGDGKQDVIAGGVLVGEPGSNTPPEYAAYIFYGNGDGTLQTGKVVDVALPFVAADFNHDGITDVASVSIASPQSLSVLLGSSSGSFTTAPPVSLPSLVTDGSYNLAYAGIDSSRGEVNLATLGATTTILRGDGKGGFTVGESYPYTLSTLVPATDADGTANLVLYDDFNLRWLPANANGTYPGPITFPVGIFGFAAADYNGDGLTDVIACDDLGNLVTGLSRGDGSFATKSQPTSVLAQILLSGDFNGDGKQDAVAINQGTDNNGDNQSQDAELYFYNGNGDGSFQAATAGVDLHNFIALRAATGDFNGDGKLDIVISFSAAPPTYAYYTNTLVILPGNGDGTFGSGIVVDQSISPYYSGGQVLVADLNNDKKLDLIWNNNAYLNAGNGTFKSLPLSVPDAFLYTQGVGDLNGDGIPDLVVTTNVYTGNGDGTFQSNPFYTTTLPQGCGYQTATLVGDINADGHPDLLLLCSRNGFGGGGIGGFTGVVVSLGDDKGNLTADSNTYFTGTSAGGYDQPQAWFARLNANAPPLSSDNAPDLLTFTNMGATGVLNQINPATEVKLPTVTSLSISPNSANVGAPVTFAATVSGGNPTGSVSFVSGTTTIGSASLVEGTATLMTSLASAGTLSLTANYAGDIGNLPSQSSPVLLTILGPDFSVAASPASATISAGQTATTTLTVTSLVGYTGTVKFSCGTLPSETTCSFSQSSVTPSANSTATTTLTVTTTAASAALRHDADPGQRPWQVISWAGAVLLLLSQRRIKRFNQRLQRSALLLFFLIAGLATLSGCGGSSGGGGSPGNPGTPTGVQTITVTAADSTNGPSHSINFQITVQ